MVKLKKLIRLKKKNINDLKKIACFELYLSVLSKCKLIKIKVKLFD